jgi:hypothetical protein
VIVNRKVGRTKPEERVYYLLLGKDGNRPQKAVEILDGNPELFLRLARHNPYKTKTYNFLISFAENREELESKLEKKGITIEELYRELLSYLFPPEYYPREALNILAVAHSDTDNFHIHLTVENYDHLNKKSLYIPVNLTEIRFYRALENYINAKYGLSSGVMKAMNAGKAGTEKIKKILEERGIFKNKTRDEVKEEITNYLVELINLGEIGSREELLVYLQAVEGLEIKRIGKSYVSFEYAGQRYRLKGGIYDEQRFKEFIERSEGKRPDCERLAELFEVLKRKRKKYIEKRRRSLGGRTPLPRLEQSNRRSSLPVAGEVEELGSPDRKLPRKERTPDLDTAFPLDWLAANNAVLPVSSIGRNASSPAPKLRSSDGPVGREVEDLQAAGRSPMHGRRQLAKLSNYSYSSQRLREIKEMREELREIRKLEIELLKELDPEEVLSALGIEYKKMNGYLLMRSPVREGDENPSFTVFYATGVGYWIYKDHATGWKGSSIDLWMAVKGVDYITAVKEMRERFGVDYCWKFPDSGRDGVSKFLRTLRKQQKEKREKLNSDKEFVEKRAFKVLEISNAITDKNLKNYLAGRGITRIPGWLKQVRYQHLATGKVYVGLAVENVSGALNVRTPQGKYVILREPAQFQTYSLIKRSSGNKKLLIVEGLFDALSIEQVHLKRDYDILVLNSVNNMQRVLQDGVLEGYERLVIALDNDPEGLGTMESLIEALRGRYELVRLLYEGKDLNEWLVEHRSSLPRAEVISKPYYAGIFKVGRTYGLYGEEIGTYELVITDNLKVLERLGQEKELRKVIRTSGAEIPILWREWRFKGAPRIITEDGNAPEWLLKAMEKSEKEWNQCALPEPKQEKYWLINGKIVFREDIENAPERYLQSELEEIRRVAIGVKENKRLKSLKERSEKGYGSSL